MLKDISMDKLQLILKQLTVWKKDVEWFELGGGEPLLYKDLSKLIIEIKKEFRNAKILLVSNAMLADVNILAVLKQAGLDRIQFSLDGGLPETHAKIRQNQISYQRVSDACINCRKLRIPFALRLTVIRDNINEIEQFFDTAKRWGADEVGLRSVILAGQASFNSNKLSINRVEYKNLLKLLPSISEKYQIPYFSGDPLAIIANDNLLNNVEKRYGSCNVFGGCLVGISYIYINNNGDVAFCPMLNRLVLGDPTKIQISTIWSESEEYKRMRKRNFYGRCGTCTFSKLCGGCRANAYLANNDLFGEDPMCELYKPV